MANFFLQDADTGEGNFFLRGVDGGESGVADTPSNVPTTPPRDDLPPPSPIALPGGDRPATDAPRAQGLTPLQVEEAKAAVEASVAQPSPIPMFDEANPDPGPFGFTPAAAQVAPNFFEDVTPEKLDNDNPVAEFLRGQIVGAITGAANIRSQALAIQRGVGQIPGGLLKSSAEAAGALGLVDSPEETAAFALGEAIETTFDPNPKEIRPGFFTEDLPGAIGTTGGFALGGAIGTALQLPKMATAILIPTTLGAAVGADELYRDAIASGGTDEQAYTAYVSGLGFGASEGLPISRLLGRLDTSLGGGVKKILAEGFKGGMEELIQEVFQQWGGNITASDIAGYDPERSAVDNLGQAAKVGGGAGFLLSTLAAAMGVKMRNPPTVEQQAKAFRERAAQLQTNIEEPGAITGEPLQEQEQVLEGSFVPLAPRDFELAAKKVALEQTFTDTLKELGAQDLTQPNIGDQQQFAPDTLTKRNRRMDINPLHFTEQELFVALNNSLKPGLAKEPGAQEFFDVQSFLDGGEQVAAIGFQGFTGTENDVDLAELVNVVGFGTQTDAEALGKTPQEIRSRLRAAETKMAEVGLERLQAWAKPFFPAKKIREEGFVVGTEKPLKVIFSDGSFSRSLEAAQGNPVPKGIKTGVNGWMFLANRNLLIVEVNSQKFVDGFLGDFVPKDTSQKAQQKFFGVLAHEFGHGIAATQLERAPLDVQEAIYAQYEQHLKEAVDGTDLKTFVGKWFRTDKAARMTEAINEQLEKARELREAGNLEEAERVEQSIQTVPRHVNSFTNGASYILSFDEYFAEQVSRSLQKRLAGDPKVSGFFSQLAKTLKRFYEKTVKRFAPTSTVDSFIELALTKHEISQRQEQAVRDMKKSGETVSVDARMMKVIRDTHNNLPPIPPGDSTGEFPPPSEIQEGLDTFNKGIKFAFSLPQLAQVNSHNPLIQQYMKLTERWENTRLTWIGQADQRLQEWAQLNKQENKSFASFLFEMTLKSDQLKRKLSTAETQELIDKHNVTDDMLTLLDGVQGDMSSVVDSLEQILLQDSAKLHADNIHAAQNSELEIREQMELLRNRDFFPLSRFGEYFVEVKANRRLVHEGKTIDIGGTVTFPMYTSKREMRKDFAKMKREFGPDFTVSSGRLSKDTFAFHGMPAQLIKTVEGLLTGEENLEKISAFRKAIQDISPAQLFAKHMLNRKGTPGFSLNAMQGYGDYFSRFANHIARIEFSGQLQEVIDQMEKTSRDIRDRGKDSVKRDDITTWLKDHKDYILNPKNEFSNIRSIGFHWYLSFLPKSAFVNLTQVATVTYPHLAAKYGDKNAVREILKAYKTTKNIFRMQHERIEPELRTMLARGVQEGWLDESQALMLAGIAEGSTLQQYVGGRFLGSDRAQQKIRQFSYYGAYLFQTAEKVNRRVTAIAAFRLARQKGMGLEEAHEAAKVAVRKTQYEYARWARPEFMRGRRSVIFLFWQHLTNTLFFAFGGDPGWWRFMLMMLFLGGVGGPPLVDNAMELWNFVAKKAAKYTGWENPIIDVQQEIREMVHQLGANPDLIMQGVSRYSFGWPQIDSLGLTGFHGFDLSGSLQMGDSIPGLTNFLSDGRTADKFMSGTTDLAGAAVSVPVSFFKAVNDDHPDAFKRWERAMPSAVRNVARAWHLGSKGFAEGRKGEVLEKFDMTDPLQMVEIIGQAAGFTPTRLAQRKESDWVTRQAIVYWETRRRMIMQNMAWARAHKDAEAVKEVKKSWKRFNNQVPKSRMKIGNKDMSTSLQTRKKGKRLAEKQIPVSRRYRGMTEEILETFPEANPGSRSVGDNFFQKFVQD